MTDQSKQRLIIALTVISTEIESRAAPPVREQAADYCELVEALRQMLASVRLGRKVEPHVRVEAIRCELAVYNTASVLETLRLFGVV